MNSDFDAAPAVAESTLRYLCIPKGNRAFIKKRMKEKHIFSLSTLAEQVYLLTGEGERINVHKKYLLTFKQVSDILLIGGANKAKRLYAQGKQRHYGTNKSAGRPSTLTKQQELDIIQHILVFQNDNNPMSPSELLEYVNEKYNVNLGQSWPFNFHERHNNQLKIIDADPLEEERADLTIDQLKRYKESVEKVLECHHQDLICNWDQTASEDLKASKKSVIVVTSKNQDKYFYKVKQPQGHITVMPAIFPDGSSIRPLVIIIQKTIDNDLEPYGLPDGKTGFVVSTSSGFTTSDAHLEYVNKVVIPFFEERRKTLNLPYNERALILQDGLKAHLDDMVTKVLDKNFIDTYEFPAHSSHLTQPLDLVSFPIYKRELRRFKSAPKHLTERSQRLYNIAYCIGKVTRNPLMNHNAFESGGFLYNLSKSEKMSFNLSKITQKRRSPQDNLTVEDLAATARKPKRIKVKRLKTKREKFLKPDYIVTSSQGLKLRLRKA